MRRAWYNRSLLLAFGASLALHAAVLVGSRLVPRAPRLATRPGERPQTLILLELPMEGPATAPATLSPSTPTPVPPPAPPENPSELEVVEPPPPEPLVEPPPVSALEEAVVMATHSEPPAPPPLSTRSAAPSPPLPTIAAPAVPVATSVARGQADTPTLDAGAGEAGPVAVRARPSYRFNPEPAYPPIARRRHQEGLVLLHVQVSAEGRASEVRVAASSGYPLLDEAARTAVRRWTFEPGRLGMVAVASEIQVPVQFKLVGEQETGGGPP